MSIKKHLPIILIVAGIIVSTISIYLLASKPKITGTATIDTVKQKKNKTIGGILLAVGLLHIAGGAMLKYKKAGSIYSALYSH
jgi:hypothetical protein